MATRRGYSGTNAGVLGAGEGYHLEGMKCYHASYPAPLGIEEMYLPYANADAPPLPEEVPLPDKDWLVPRESDFFKDFQEKVPSMQCHTIVDRQMQKTKLCTFHAKGKCAFGSECTYAHSPDQVRGMPNLSKTKLCTKWRRNSCYNKNCKYAHGFEELRNTPMLYKTSMCTAAMTGSCTLGNLCRAAPTPDEPR
eukprot:TRINITY_DN66901_c0_g1_i1.p1 TRINITY_DN66901_c0_g1~~TRINITY_DN66901_c0_g1_i1.p1  ORF type:complete len:213 (+),score=28.26 TRINITY_DN66901_c0_g1_i1:58-639(+)